MKSFITLMRKNGLSPFKHTCFHSLAFWRSFTSAAMVTQIGVTTGCSSSFVNWSFSIVRTNLVLGQKNHVHESSKIKLKLKKIFPTLQRAGWLIVWVFTFYWQYFKHIKDGSIAIKIKMDQLNLRKT